MFHTMELLLIGLVNLLHITLDGLWFFCSSADIDGNESHLRSGITTKNILENCFRVAKTRENASNKRNKSN